MILKNLNGKDLKAVVGVNAITINTTGFEVKTTKNELEDVSKVIIDNDYEINLKESIEVSVNFENITYTTKYKINQIQVYPEYIEITEFEKNKDNILLIPLIFDDFFKILKSSYFINCYLDTNHPTTIRVPNLIYLSFRFTPFKDSIEIDEYLSKQPNFIDKFDDGNCRIYSFRILSKHLEDFKKLKNKNTDVSKGYLSKITGLTGFGAKEISDKIKNNCILSIQDIISQEYNTKIPLDCDFIKAITYSKHPLLWKMRNQN